MLFYLAKYLTHFWHIFDVFHYLTLRAILAAISALAISWIVGPVMIRRFSQYKIGQPIRKSGPQSHLSKAGTPTMGGALILIAVAIATLLWSNLGNRYVWTTLLVTLGFGFIGWIDDYRKLVKGNSEGISAKQKILSQTIVALAASSLLYFSSNNPTTTTLIVPFFKYITFQLGLFYILFSSLVIVGTSNAVNLTDGLDGLAIMPTVMIAAALGVFAYLVGNAFFAHYLLIPHIYGVGELAVFCGAIVGAGLGFLWFNAYPAQIFMGDTGSLGLGAALGIVAVIARQELVLMLMGGICVAETVSVILQISYFRISHGKRLFLMAPLRQSYHLCGRE